MPLKSLYFAPPSSNPRTMRLRLGVLLAVLFLATAMSNSSPGQGFADWSWTFDQPYNTGGPSDSILLTATISVRPNSPGPLVGHAVINFQGSLFTHFDFDYVTSSFDANIPAGSSWQFTFGTLTPKSPVAPGIYRNLPDEPLIDFIQLGTRHISDGPLRIEVVPEPATTALMFLGIAVLTAKFGRSRGLCSPP
jgi:hypothetical protein